jgi:two-component system cell cycle sensor histidine kinase/response regulator CckA
MSGSRELFLRSPRKVLSAALLLLFAHAVVIGVYGGHRPGPLLSNLLQLALGLLTIACCVSAMRISGAFGRMFWKLAGAAFSMWCIGQTAGTYYASILNLSTQNFWAIDMFFTAWLAPLVMCLFLDQEEESLGFDWQRVLDFSQVGIVFLLLYFFFSDISRHGTELGTWRLSAVTDGILTIGFLTRAESAGKNSIGALFRWIGYFRLVAFLTDLYFALGFTVLADNSWFDLVWSAPWLIPLLAATRWDGQEKIEPPASAHLRERRMIITQVLPLISPVLVLLLAAEVAQAQLIIAAFAVLGSLCVSYARMIMTHQEQRRTAEAQRQQQGLLEAIAEGTTEAIFVKDLQGRYLMINTAGAQMIGLSVAEVVGKDDGTFFPEETARKIMERDRKVMESGVPQTYEERTQWHGTNRTFLSTKGPYRDGRGNIVGLVGIALDITERNRAAEALAESEERFRTLFQGSPIGISVIDMDGKVFAVNAAYRKMLNLDPEETVTTHLFDEVTHPENREADALLYAELARGVREQDRTEKRYLLRDKREVWADLHLYLLRDRSSQPRFVIGMAIDITERKLLEDQLRRAQRMETIGTLAGGVAHDFNNLLTVIKGYCNLLMGRLKDDRELTSQMEYIDRAAEQAASLTRQLLAFSRQQVLQPKVFNLNELVTNADKMLRRLIGENIEMVAVTARDLGSVKADPGQIESVIMNLAVNARDAMPNGGKLTLETANADLDDAYAHRHLGSKPGRYVMLTVSDTGVGMDRETIAHIFEPFFTTKEVGKGTGLGLSAVYGVVKQSEGYVWVHSEPGKGSTFKVYLPRVDEAAQAVPEKTKAAATQGGTETILLVEDDPQVRDLTRDVLEARGYRVLVAERSLEAPVMCAGHDGIIDLLLTDVVMPGLGGNELALQILKQRPAIKILFMSGYTDNSLLQGASLSNGFHFLQKPFTPSSLAAKIREILDQCS